MSVSAGMRLSFAGCKSSADCRILIADSTLLRCRLKNGQEGDDSVRAAGLNKTKECHTSPARSAS